MQPQTLGRCRYGFPSIDFIYYDRTKAVYIQVSTEKWSSHEARSPTREPKQIDFTSPKKEKFLTQKSPHTWLQESLDIQQKEQWYVYIAGKDSGKSSLTNSRIKQRVEGCGVNTMLIEQGAFGDNISDNKELPEEAREFARSFLVK